MMINRKGFSRKIKKDYQAKNLCNPFFRRPKKSLKRGFLLSFLGLIILLLTVGFWFFCSAPIWKIKHISIEGLTRFDGREIESLIWEQAAQSAVIIFNQTNIFLFDEEKFREQAINDYNFSDLKIIKKLPSSLIVKIYERPYAFIFQQGSDYFYASKDAYVVNRATVSEEDKQYYFILENKTGNNFLSSGSKITIPDSYLEFVLSMTDYLKNSQDVRVEKYVIDLELNTVKIKCQDGPEVYFNTRNQVSEQIDRLMLVKKEKIKDNFSGVSYIDLRYGDKIFIK